MSDNAPIPFRWDGEAMRPVSRRPLTQFEIGEVYILEEREDASDVSHKHFHATINTAWKTLPENVSSKFPTPTHLRKWALVKAGFYHVSHFPCRNHNDALRYGAFIRNYDDLAVITTEGPERNVVAVYTAKSTRSRRMKKDEFQLAKQGVFNVLSEMLGVSSAELAKHGGASHDDYEHR